MPSTGVSIARWANGTLCAIVCATALWLVAPAQAALPGKPGQIVFSSTFAGDREIFVAAPDGSGRVDLTRDPHADVTPSWSADGKRIAFASDRSGSMEIYLMNADGSAVTQLTHDSSFADHPRMTADGRYVVYESKKGGNWEIRRIGVDGSGEVDLTRNHASDRYPGNLSQRASRRVLEQSRHERHAYLGHEHQGQCSEASDGAQGQPVRAHLGAGRRPAGVRIGHALGRHEHLDGACQRQGQPPAHDAAIRRATQPILVSRRPLDRLRELHGQQHRRLHALRDAARWQSARHLATTPAVSGYVRRRRRQALAARPRAAPAPTNIEANGQAHDDACRELGTGRPVRPDRGATGAPRAA